MKQSNNFSSVRQVESDSVNKEATDNDLHSVAAKAPPPQAAQATPAPPPLQPYCRQTTYITFPISWNS
ncbi:hypothetical protein J6590_022990 [Homalodisca vitripennis]|nr:hypothetical protein J6590_022990 [Homalodisca vitripennis]